ncbi:MAG: O-antigen ligase family protein [Candidatus Moranbacteria bacterium]|nr:O-antigen ligase family protein [Candidatus Moranbacteria bacterium]
MLAQIKYFVNSLNKTRVGLVFWASSGVFFLIVLQNTGVLPLGASDFFFFALVALGLAMYRPSWAFLFFISVITIENVNLAPENIGIMVRPYQLLGALVILAVIARLASKKLGFKLAKITLWDYLVIAIAVSGFLSAAFSSSKGASFKLSIILASFAALYFLVRNYVQDRTDLGRIAPFFLSSVLIVSAYGIWQNIRNILGQSSFEVMPGRPNATFPEPDWLGMFLVFALAAVYALMYFYERRSAEESLDDPLSRIGKILLYVFLIPIFILLFIAVSRSAWLGAAAVTVVFLCVSFIRVMRKEWNFWEFAKMKIGIVSMAVIALAFVFIFHLTSFQLFNRATSTSSGLQKITVACETQSEFDSLKNPIENISQLENTGCEHIDLEDIESEKSRGFSVGEISRKDPTSNIRAEIYKKSWQEIKKSPVFGIGWGSIGQVLGKDENGATLNSSNIFLEIWLGSGIIGILSFVAVFGYILFGGLRCFFQEKGNADQAIGIFLTASWFAIVIPNLFNAGILMAYVWVWLGISVSLIENRTYNR